MAVFSWGRGNGVDHQSRQFRNDNGALFLVKGGPHGYAVGRRRYFEKAQLLHGASPAGSAAQYREPRVVAAKRRPPFGRAGSHSDGPGLATELAVRRRRTVTVRADSSTPPESTRGCRRVAPRSDAARRAGGTSRAHRAPSLKGMART